MIKAMLSEAIKSELTKNFCLNSLISIYILRNHEQNEYVSNNKLKKST